LAAFLPIAALRPAGVVARRRSSNVGGWSVIVGSKGVGGTGFPPVRFLQGKLACGTMLRGERIGDRASLPVVGLATAALY
jgi:hypothetical protein